MEFSTLLVYVLGGFGLLAAIIWAIWPAPDPTAPRAPGKSPYVIGGKAQNTTKPQLNPVKYVRPTPTPRNTEQNVEPIPPLDTSERFQKYWAKKNSARIADTDRHESPPTRHDDSRDNTDGDTSGSDSSD